jgi:biopolymer transport protein ExbB
LRTNLVSVASMNSLEWGWNWSEIWNSMTWIGHDVIYILVVMLASSITISIDRAFKYIGARRQSRAFALYANPRLRNGDIQGVIEIANSRRKSHIGKVVAAGILSFNATVDSLSHRRVIETARLALKRSAINTHSELKRGLAGLATIGATAPLVGLFGTIIGLMTAFKGCGAQRAACMAATVGGICDALVSTTLGLIVAVPAVWLYNYFTNSMEGFDIEIENSALELISYLTIRLRLGRDP